MSPTIDVVVPSFRLNEKNLLPVFNMRIPDQVIVNFFLVIDNPDAIIPASLSRLADQRRIHILINDNNRGASYTRNRGMDAGTGEWILFLDDDLSVPENLLETYWTAIESCPSEIGFIGLVRLPAPETDFAKAVKISGAMDIFEVAQKKPSFVWGATANFLLKRSALKGVRFSLVYPKSGGGEDVDLFLKIRARNGFKNYRSLPEALVHYPWWNHGQKDFKKPDRYGLGNSWLGQLNPVYSYYDFLNTIELMFLCLMVLPVFLLVSLHAGIKLIIFIAGILVIECIASFIQTFRRSRLVNLRIAWYVMALRIVYEAGLLRGNLMRLRIAGFGERFHDDGKMNKFFIYRTNTYRIVKWILYPILIYLLIRSV